MTLFGQPPASLPQEPADYRWAATGELDEAHAFPPTEEGRLPSRCACGERRWTAAFGYSGSSMSRSCVAALRDQLRAIVVALAKAGIHVVDPPRADAYERRPGLDLNEYDAPTGAGESVEASRG